MKPLCQESQEIVLAQPVEATSIESQLQIVLQTPSTCQVTGDTQLDDHDEIPEDVKDPI